MADTGVSSSTGATGAGAAALGSPLNSVAWLANTMGRLGIPLKAGEVILSGSLAIMVPVKAGDSLHASVAGLGGCASRTGARATRTAADRRSMGHRWAAARHQRPRVHTPADRRNPAGGT